jgi:hypothetical protein
LYRQSIIAANIETIKMIPLLVSVDVCMICRKHSRTQATCCQACGSHPGF